VTSRSDRRAFFERSLADLDEEHAAGDLSDDDHARLRAEYERRLAGVDDGADGSKPTLPARRPGLVVASVVFVLVVAVGAGILVALAAGRREPGQSASGDAPSSAVGGDVTTTTLDVPEALQACFDADGSAALDCYINYTRSNPDDAQGFLYFGLYSINQGIQANSQELLDGGVTFLRRALEIDPGQLQARANLAVVLERTGHDDEAREELSHLAGVELPDDVQQLVDFVQSNLAADASSTTTTATTP
jgi:cytochrome c-type biogenesis protein CcmI